MRVAVVTSASTNQREGRTRRQVLRALAIVLALAICDTRLAAFSGADDKEAEVRAAFLLNFIKFTTWPAEAFDDPGDDFVIAVVGPDPFGQVLEQTFEKVKVQGRKVVIRRWSLPDPDKSNSPGAHEEAVARLKRRVESAHLVYVTVCKPEELELVFKGVDTSHVLTVGSEHRCAASHTALALDREGDRVIFYVNVRILKALKLQVSSRLLSLAKTIEDSTQQGGKP